MGGKALKTIKVSSMDKDTFEKVSDDIIKKLKNELGTELIDILPYYRSKNTFGDVDVLISKTSVEKYGFNQFHDFLRNTLESPEQSGNSQIYSFGYKYNDSYHQIDLMLHDDNMFYKAKNYFAYNDLNILMNFIAVSNFDISFSKEGLNHIIYGEEKTKKIGEYTVNADFYEILDFLGLNKEKHKIGFNSLKDMYDFIYESPYFDSDSFITKIERENRAEIKRAERKTYSGFIEYVKNKPKKKSILKDKNKEEVQDLFFFKFPIAKKEYNKIGEDYKKLKEMKESFNGFLICEWLNIDIKDRFLGVVMRKVKSDFNNDDHLLADWIKENGKENLKQLVIRISDDLKDKKDEWSKYQGGKSKI